jgi:hypothetical protein
MLPVGVAVSVRSNTETYSQEIGRALAPHHMDLKEQLAFPE